MKPWLINDKDDEYFGRRLHRVAPKEGQTKGCLEWQGPFFKDGYGLFNLRSRATITASRYAYQRYYGIKLPSSIRVCHHCDNPPCCEPTHLFKGTDKDNAQDSKRKNRRGDRNGQRNGAAKLTNEQAVEIRERRKRTGESGRIIALDYGVCENTILNVLRGECYKCATT